MLVGVGLYIIVRVSRFYYGIGIIGIICSGLRIEGVLAVISGRAVIVLGFSCRFIMLEFLHF